MPPQPAGQAASSNISYTTCFIPTAKDAKKDDLVKKDKEVRLSLEQGAVGGKVK